MQGKDPHSRLTCSYAEAPPEGGPRKQGRCFSSYMDTEPHVLDSASGSQAESRRPSPDLPALRQVCLPR